MPKKRVHEIAKEQGLTSKQVLAALKDAGVYVKAASSTVEERDVRRAFPNGAKAAPAPPKKAAKPKPPPEPPKKQNPIIKAKPKAAPKPVEAEPAPVVEAEPAPAAKAES